MSRDLELGIHLPTSAPPGSQLDPRAAAPRDGDEDPKTAGLVVMTRARLSQASTFNICGDEVFAPDKRIRAAALRWTGPKVWPKQFALP